MDWRTFISTASHTGTSNQKMCCFQRRAKSKFVISEAARSLTQREKTPLTLFPDTTALQNSCFAWPSIQQRLIFGQLGAFWRSCTLWRRFSRESRKGISFSRLRQDWEGCQNLIRLILMTEFHTSVRFWTRLMIMRRRIWTWRSRCRRTGQIWLTYWRKCWDTTRVKGLRQRRLWTIHTLMMWEGSLKRRLRSELKGENVWK